MKANQSVKGSKSSSSMGVKAKPVAPARSTVAKTSLQGSARQIAKSASKVSAAKGQPSNLKLNSKSATSSVNRNTSIAKGAQGPKDYRKLSTSQVGKIAEQKAAKFLKKEGYKVATGQHNSIHGIDIIAFKGNKPVFTEVKGSQNRVRPFSNMKHQVQKSWIRDRFSKLEASTSKTSAQEKAVKNVRRSFGLDPKAPLPKANSSLWKGQGVSVDLAHNTIRLYDQTGRIVKQTRLDTA